MNTESNYVKLKQRVIIQKFLYGVGLTNSFCIFINSKKRNFHGQFSRPDEAFSHNSHPNCESLCKLIKTKLIKVDCEFEITPAI